MLIVREQPAPDLFSGAEHFSACYTITEHGLQVAAVDYPCPLLAIYGALRLGVQEMGLEPCAPIKPCICAGGLLLGDHCPYCNGTADAALCLDGLDAATLNPQGGALAV